MQVPKADYLTSGRWKVIDQGQDFIGGYIDDHSKVIKFTEPLIVFGDHTRIFKFVDFDCALGADGTKPLLASDEFVPKFLYYALSNMDIPARGYNRHFSILREMQIPRPVPEDQLELVAILDVVDRKIELHRAKHSILGNLFTVLLHQLISGKISVRDLVRVP